MISNIMKKFKENMIIELLYVQQEHILIMKKEDLFVKNVFKIQNVKEVIFPFILLNIIGEINKIWKIFYIVKIILKHV